MYLETFLVDAPEDFESPFYSPYGYASIYCSATFVNKYFLTINIALCVI